MSAPDMDVIKEIPGYKVILKAVLKSQIQQLVETLATHTDEESVILTASVSDGTLSHLGSESGKSFLEDHEDVKSQFLGFCLRRHHRKKQSEQEALRSPPAMPPQFGLGPSFQSRPAFSPRVPRMNIQRHSTPRHPVIPQGGYRPPGRHEPYPVSRPMKRNSLDLQDQGLGLGTSSSPVKVEPVDNDNSDVNNTSVPSSSQTNNDKSDSISGVNQDGSAEAKQSTSVLDESTQDSNLSSDTTLPNTPNAQNTENSETDLDPNISVKLESITENEMELEITGVEPGRNMGAPQENWVPDNSAGMGFDPSGATGNQSDLSAGSQDYKFHSTTNRNPARQSVSYGNVSDSNDIDLSDITELLPIKDTILDQEEGRNKRFVCNVCGKRFKDQWHLDTHFRTHSGEKPFVCEICHRSFSTKGNMRSHMVIHMRDIQL